MNTYVLSHFEHKIDITIIVKMSQSYSPAACGSLQSLTNDCDVIMSKL